MKIHWSRRIVVCQITEFLKLRLRGVAIIYYDKAWFMIMGVCGCGTVEIVIMENRGLMS